MTTSGWERAVATAVNGVEVLRFGGLRVEEDPAPFEVVAHQPVFRLRRYFPGGDAGRQPVLLVPPLMQVAEVWDISPSTSAVRILHDEGLDPWVIDFGDPATEPGGPQRSFGDHVLALADAIERVRQATGLDVHVGGYSQGGVFCYVAAAYLACRGVGSIFVLGSPVGWSSLDTFVPERLVWDAARLQAKVLARTGIHRRVVQESFKWATPQRNLKADLDFLLALHDRESLLPREPQRRFLKRGAWIGWSGPAIAELVEFASENRFMEGGVVIGKRTVGLADITCPVLLFSGESDPYGPPHLVRKIVAAAPKAEVYECVLPVGHFGLPVSSYAREKTWPGTAAFVRWVVGQGDLPDHLTRLRVDDVITDEAVPVRSRLAGLTYGAGLAAGTALAAPGAAARTAQRAAGVARELSGEVAAQLPRLLRLERMGPGTRISYGRLLSEAARSRGGDVAFLYEGRAYDYAASDRRIDNVVRGLTSVGVRRGEHVGVLMDARPSALVTVAALNRIGAVAVLLRPGPDIGLEQDLAQATRVVTDPEHVAEARTLGVGVFVLGGGAGQRDLPPGVVDLERVDPDAVTLPGWYRPDPGRARDVAFILFTGHGGTTRADRITNGRWATSAYAAASAAALTSRDTVYSMSPLHHASGLLLTTAAPVASGARLAMATRFDPDTFWGEVRRYGVTVVPYTWTMLHALVAAPEQPEERNHPIRLFIGSGMPAGLWHRVEQRFAPARVLELYASTRSDAMLANVSGRKVGASGKPLPGTPRARVVRCDPDGRMQVDSDGFAVEAEVGETGLLLVEASRGGAGGNDRPLLGVFAPDDAWTSTSDLFRVDEDGDLWFVDSLSVAIDTQRGRVSPRTVETALTSSGATDLAAAYPVSDAGGRTLAVAAVTLLPGHTLDADVLQDAFRDLGPGERPDVVQVRDELPVTSWFRPSVADLRAGGVPADGPGVWRLDGERWRCDG